MVSSVSVWTLVKHLLTCKSTRGERGPRLTVSCPKDFCRGFTKFQWLTPEKSQGRDEKPSSSVTITGLPIIWWPYSTAAVLKLTSDFESEYQSCSAAPTILFIFILFFLAVIQCSIFIQCHGSGNLCLQLHVRLPKKPESAYRGREIARVKPGHYVLFCCLPSNEIYNPHKNSLCSN